VIENKILDKKRKSYGNQSDKMSKNLLDSQLIKEDKREIKIDNASSEKFIEPDESANFGILAEIDPKYPNLKQRHKEKKDKPKKKKKKDN